ncbi:thioredoxin reductase (NADPH) [Pedobacter cryoconitis]|uniref:Thioredoxin reductase (NADPH) n=1 Tax=Pedobacter cryoconitis TaxID=188932 RepID=A0A7W8YYE7_9SPHI|nr:FAD-dependent oxidoreductase [Pedobacter cryoconitis]MBB5624041.1 thioredoxin reductase (NADPH) [Pedobacter cryoconitis]MBB5647275.1 thioredoxin reductase (NADPH) [Pedobacter cryoconitis]
MNLPIIFSIDDDPQVLRAISRDLKIKYGKEYKILSTTSAQEALDMLIELKNSADVVALFLCDQRMPEMEGVAFLEKAMLIYPEAKRVLLTAYSDTEAAIKAINEVKLDYYLIKPWDPPEDKLYPVINDLLDDWQGDYTPEFKGIRVVGFQFSPLSHVVKDYLASNLIPYRWMDVQTNPDATSLLTLNKLTNDDLPVVLMDDGTFLTKPSIKEIAAKIGKNPEIIHDMYDVVIIGAGPAGLAAAVYGASEGLKTLMIERKAPGGQAGTSSRIENYLGFPAGLSGADLTRRAISQAVRLGAGFLSPQSVSDIKQKDGYKTIILEDGPEIISRSVIITTGVDYRKLEVKGVSDLTGAGIYYGAATTEASACRDKNVYIIGGGNSAGQAAMYLSKFACSVNIVVRKDDLTSTMSSYLIDQIGHTPNVHVLGNTEVIEAKGDKCLEKLVLINVKTKETREEEAAALYIFIGAKPYTDWLKLDILKDEKGFIETGRELRNYENFNKTWKLKRDPFLLETSCAGIFAAGDVRSGAMNRVASAVGEGSMAISFVHKYLAEV